MATEADSSGRVKVRITMFEEPIVVHESELPSLRSQGLLIEETEKPPRTPPPSGQPPAASGT